MKKYFIFFFLILLGEIVFSQPVRVVPQEISGREKSNVLYEVTQQKNYRLEASNLQVPFFDNFNYGAPSAFYNNWDSSGVEIVKLLDGPAAYGIKFNGIKLKGDTSKYSKDTLQRVKTDTIVSKPFNTASISSDQAATIEFDWQGGGFGGNQPDSTIGDSLILLAKSIKGDWIKLWTSPSAKNYSKTKFYRVSIKLSDTLFAYDGLIFRFENHGLPSAASPSYFVTNFGLDISGKIPFWDDFSNPNATRSHFKSNTGVYINNHLPINQPSINVASFDGLDNNGKTYFKSSVVEIGEADSLVSWPINLEPYQRKDSLRFSFFYQKGGYGETPDLSEGDSLVLLFQTKNGAWKSFWHSDFKQTVDSSKFYQVLLTIKDSSVFHKNFKFKFFNYARLSGSFDVWNLDYITIDTTRKPEGISEIINKTLYFSDLAVSKSPTQIVGSYSSVPANHLNPSNIVFTENNSYTLSNLSSGPLQGIVSRENFYLNNIFVDSSALPSQLINQGITSYEFKLPSILTNKIKSNLKTLPDTAAPFKIKVQTSIDIDSGLLFNSTQYLFSSNDTASSTFTFDNYYAYDDGTYEFGEMLEQDKAFQAMRFESFLEDTLTDIDFCIPYIGYRIDASPFLVKVWADNNGKPGKELYSQYEIARYSTGLEPFSRFKIQKKILKIFGTFYIGYQQISGFSRSIRLGYDANTENQDKLFYDNNRGYGWSQDRNLKGTLMIRPIFGKSTLNTPIKPAIQSRMEIRPNPCNDVLYLNKENDIFEWIDIYHLNGNRVSLIYNTNKVDVSSLSPGIYIIKAYKDETIHTDKLIITSK